MNKTLTITHLNPGSLNHTQAVLESKHYSHTVTIHRIYWDGDDKIVEYDLLQRHNLLRQSGRETHLR